jgi:hypothetical protein
VIGPEFGGAEDHCLTLVRTWAEAVLRQVERVRAVRRNFHAEDRDMMTEDWTPENIALQRSWRSLWAEQHTLVWAAFQLEQWTRRLAEVRGQQPPEQYRLLADLRHSLEHLAEANLADALALVPHDVSPKKKMKWSLSRLPNGCLVLGVGGRRVFELIEPDTLRDRALAVLRELDAEVDADMEALAQDYLEMEAAARREDAALRRVEAAALRHAKLEALRHADGIVFDAFE